MSRILFLYFLGTLGLSPSAFAAVTFSGFSWQADSRFELVVNRNTQAILFKGSLRDSGRAQVQQGELTAIVHSFPEGFISIAVTSDSEDMGSVFILARENARYLPMTTGAILARKSSVASDLDGILSGLKKVNKWDTSLSFRSLANYFNSNPKRQLTDFYDQVELGNVKLVAKPEPRSHPESRKASLPPPRQAQADGDHSSQKRAAINQDNSDDPPPRPKVTDRPRQTRRPYQAYQRMYPPPPMPPPGFAPWYR